MQINQSTTPPIGLLTGKVIFVTGASRGIGKAAARLFAREGASVVLAARSVDALQKIVGEIRAAGATAEATFLDLADPDSIRASVRRVRDLFGRLDGAFNNGGTPQRVFGPVDATTDADIDEQFAVNLRANWTAMVAEADLMRQGGGGSIVNSSSIGSRRANPRLAAYGAMKRALNSLTETASVDWASSGIRVNAIAMGGTLTDMVEKWETATPGTIERMTGRIPMGRLGEPHEIAEAAAWLLSDRASYVSGVVLPVDGAAGA